MTVKIKDFWKKTSDILVRRCQNLGKTRFPPLQGNVLVVADNFYRNFSTYQNITERSTLWTKITQTSRTDTALICMQHFRCK